MLRSPMERRPRMHLGVPAKASAGLTSLDPPRIEPSICTPEPPMERHRPVQTQGLYEPSQELDSCGFGFVADTKGRPSHDIVRKALQVLCNLEHRGASGSEKSTGDGAGILTQIPHTFLVSRCRPTGLELPAPGEDGLGGQVL